MKTSDNSIRKITALAAAVLLATMCLSSCDGGTSFFQPGTTWVAIDPAQCLGNPWEQDWLARHPGDDTRYPSDSLAERAIIISYYDSLGVSVTNVISIPTYEVVCLACTCPRGDVLYLQVRDEDVATMVGLGFRVGFPQWPPPRDTALTGEYTYYGYDSAMTPIITGTLTIVKIDSATASGTWVLSGPDRYGPQTGSGTFEGWRDGNMLVLNLNPGWADNNVFLNGKLHDDAYTGTWEWDTFVGPTAVGKFTALKRMGDSRR